MWAFLLVAPLQAHSQEISKEEAWVRAQALLESPDELRFAGMVRGYYFQGQHFSVRVEKEAGLVTSYSSREQNPKGTKFSTSELQQRATAFAKRALNPEIVNDLKLQEVRPYDGGMNAGVSFLLRASEGDVLLPNHCEIDMDSYTGRVRNFYYSHAEVVRPWPVAKITKEQAIEIALKAIHIPRFDPAATKSQFSIGILKDDKHENLIFWTITLQGLSFEPGAELAEKKSWTASVNAETGELTGYVGRRLSDVPVRLKPATGPRRILFSDQRPCWTESDQSPIYFTSYRPIKTANGKPARGSFPARIEKDGKLTALLVPDGYAFYSEVARDESQLALWVYDEIWILDLKAGRLGRLNNSERVDRKQPSWNSQGTLLATTGQGGNIYISGVAKGLGPFAMRNNYRPVDLHGMANFPTISPDGKWLAFSYKKVDPAKTVADTKENAKEWSIGVVKLEPQKDGVKPPEPIVLATQLPSVERISWFPDSKKFVVSYQSSAVGRKNEFARQPDVVTVAPKRISPLQLPILHDPNLPTGYKLIPNEVAVSPSGKKLSFCAMVWSGNPKDDAVRCIFTCNLDGSELKRLTPAKSVQLQPLTFPEKGLNALNAWGELAPKIIGEPH